MTLLPTRKKWKSSATEKTAPAKFHHQKQGHKFYSLIWRTSFMENGLKKSKKLKNAPNCIIKYASDCAGALLKQHIQVPPENIPKLTSISGQEKTFHQEKAGHTHRTKRCRTSGHHSNSSISNQRTHFSTRIMAHAVTIPSTDMLDTYHHTSLLTRPEAKRLTQLEQEMGNVLSRTDLTDKQKMDLFTITLENFRRVRGEIVNNGLMMTSTNAPQPPLQESENDDLFTKIQELIQNLNNPQQPTTDAKTAAKTINPTTPATAIKSTPKSQSPILTTQAVNLKKELINIQPFHRIPNETNSSSDLTNIQQTMSTKHSWK